MPTLAEIRGARRRDAEATKHVIEAHRVALNCLAHDDDECLCDCGCRRKEHAVQRTMISSRGHVIDAGECRECSCSRYAAAETFRCDCCGNVVRVGVDNDHCNDCLILEVDNCRDLAK